MNSAIRQTSVAALAAALLLAGCSGGGDRVKTYPVTGNIYVNGQPAAGAKVACYAIDDPTLLPLQPHAIAGADGSFKLTTYRTGDGAPAGTYALTVKWPLPPLPGHDGDGPDRLKGRYADPKRPARRIVVTTGTNDLETIELK
jgi:hypothetical protein